MRLPLPAAYFDPAFIACMQEVIDTPEMVENFDRLYGCALSKGQHSDADFRAFTNFVHDGIYMRLPDEAIHSLRAPDRPTAQEGAQ